MTEATAIQQYSYSSYSNYSPMAYKTINVKPSTYEELVKYKIGGKSFDDILRIFMDRIEPYELDPRFWAEMDRRLAEMRRGDFVTHEELLRELGLEPEKRRAAKRRRPS